MQAYQENRSFPNTHRAKRSPLPGPNDPVPSPPVQQSRTPGRRAGRGRRSAGRTRSGDRTRPCSAGAPSLPGPQSYPDPTPALPGRRTATPVLPRPQAKTPALPLFGPRPCSARTLGWDPRPAPARAPVLPDPGPVLHSGTAPRRRPALSGPVLPAASSGKMAARDRRARRGSEAEAK